ncbi:CAIB/BAIF family enzyme [Xylariales sp. AK1849]|nr:CAIB/BAIF family enzyme [Xylariales sp. AK1849]
MSTSQSYTVQQGAEEIFRSVLLENDRLNLPKDVIAAAARTTFSKGGIAEPYFPTSLKFTESSTALWALAATYGNAITKKRYDLDQNVVIDSDAASLFLVSSAMVRVGGKTLQDPDLAARYAKYDRGAMGLPSRRLCTNIYPTKDGRWFHLHGSMNATKSQTMLELQHTDPELKDEKAIIKIYSDRVSEYDSDWLDLEANEHFRQAGTICLKPEEYLESEQGKAVGHDPLFLLEQQNHATLPPSPWTQATSKSYRPLEGIKMLDISRVIAAPTIAKLAAVFGATVIRVSCDTQPDMGPLLVDGNLGKRDVTLNLKTDEGRRTLEDLLADADVVLDGYRPGSLERLGFGPAYAFGVAKRRGKGLVYIRENCYGWKGPMAHRSGWQQVSDCITGVSWLMGQFLGLDEPVVPLIPNSDYQTGLVGLLGIFQALDKRAEDGGNYLVSVSLSQYNSFLLSLGTYPAEIQEQLRKLHPNLKLRHYDDMVRLVGKTLQSLMGAVPQLFNPKHFWNTKSNRLGGLEDEILTFVAPAAAFDTTKLGYDVGTCFLGTYEPSWPTGTNSTSDASKH